MSKLKNVVDYSFSKNVAKKYGVSAALVFSRIIWCVRFHQNNSKKYSKRYFLDGRWWMSNTYEDFSVYFSGLITRKSIQNYILQFERDGLLISSRMKSDSWSQEKWYSPNVEICNALQENSYDETSIKSHEANFALGPKLIPIDEAKKDTFDEAKKGFNRDKKGIIDEEKKDTFDEEKFASSSYVCTESTTNSATNSHTNNQLYTPSEKKSCTSPSEKNTPFEEKAEFLTSKEEIPSFDVIPNTEVARLIVLGDEANFASSEDTGKSVPYPSQSVSTTALGGIARFLNTSQDDAKAIRQEAMVKKKAEDKAIAENRWLEKMRKPKLAPGQTMEEWEQGCCSKIFHQCFQDCARETGYHAPGWTVDVGAMWKKWFPKVGSVQNGVRVIEWCVRNWRAICQETKLKAEPTVTLLTSRYTDQAIAELLKPGHQYNAMPNQQTTGLSFDDLVRAKEERRKRNGR